MPSTGSNKRLRSAEKNLDEKSPKWPSRRPYARKPENSRRVRRDTETARRWRGIATCVDGRRAQREHDQALRLLALWAGIPAIKVHQMSSDYGVAGLTAQEPTALVSAWQAGAISEQTLFQNLQRGEVVAEGVTFEEEQERIRSGRQVPDLSDAAIELQLDILRTSRRLTAEAVADLRDIEKKLIAEVVAGNLAVAQEPTGSADQRRARHAARGLQGDGRDDPDKIGGIAEVSASATAASIGPSAVLPPASVINTIATTTVVDGALQVEWVELAGRDNGAPFLSGGAPRHDRGVARISRSSPRCADLST